MIWCTLLVQFVLPILAASTAHLLLGTPASFMSENPSKAAWGWNTPNLSAHCFGKISVQFRH